MSQLIESKRKKQIAAAARNLEEMMRRIEPYVRKPVEDQKKPQVWVNSGTNNKFKNINLKSK